MHKLVKSIVAIAAIAAFAAFLLLTNPGRTAAQGPPGGAPVVVQNTPLPTSVTNTPDVNVASMPSPVATTVTNWPDSGGWRPYEQKCNASTPFVMLATEFTASCDLTTNTDIGENEILVIEHLSVNCLQPASATAQQFQAKVVKFGDNPSGVEHYVPWSPPSIVRGSSYRYATVGLPFRYYVEDGNNITVSAVRSATDDSMDCEVGISGHIVTLPSP